MKKKEQTLYKVKSLLAACEITACTPNARKYLAKYEKDTDERFHPSTLASSALAASYTGDETPENVGVNNFCQLSLVSFEGCPRISFPDSYTLKQIAELYYQELCKKEIKTLKEKLADWEIDPKELFPEAPQGGVSIH